MAEPRDLPSIDALLGATAMATAIADFGTQSVKQALRRIQSQWRSAGTAPGWAADPAAWAEAVRDLLAPAGYRVVFNLTGTVLHTNLGRALLSDALLDDVRELVTRPMSLEYDVGRGTRGDRDGPVARRLCLLTGAEAATVVNNNAAALVLLLNTLALNRTVPVSRGELIEIGGSFRLPDIMERAGCRLLEIGTTNRTHPADYEDALAESPAMLLKVHPSNYQVTGFTRTVELSALAALGRRHGVPVCVDLGSGTLVDLARWGLPHEPTPAEMIRNGADLVTFSGDKLLGGVQAGIIVGRRDLVEACNRNPLKRALRPDKLTLSLLDRVLACYEDPATLPEHLPLLRTLSLDEAELADRGERVAGVLRDRLPGLAVDVTASPCQIGSGSLPEHTLASIAVRIRSDSGRGPADLQAALRRLPVPVIGRLSQGAVWLDMRGAEPLDELIRVLETLVPPA